jgi:hypothetical protein
MEKAILIGAIIFASLYIIYLFMKYSSEEEITIEVKLEDRTEPKFEPRKVTDLSKGTLGTDTVTEVPVPAPKKKKTYYKKRPKKSE